MPDLKSIMLVVRNLLQFMAIWAVWDMISIVLLVFSSISIVWYLWPRKKIKNVYIDVKAITTNDSTYKKIIVIEIKNLSNNAVYLESLGFKFDKVILPHPNGAKDHNTNIYEVKFEGRITGELSDIDTLVRAKQKVSTWIPVNDSTDMSVLSKAISNKQVGKLRLKFALISSKPTKLFRINIKV